MSTIQKHFQEMELHTHSHVSKWIALFTTLYWPRTHLFVKGRALLLPITFSLYSSDFRKALMGQETQNNKESNLDVILYAISRFILILLGKQKNMFMFNWNLCWKISHCHIHTWGRWQKFCLTFIIFRWSDIEIGDL